MRVHRKNIVLYSIYSKMIGFIYPQRCPGCNEILYPNEKKAGFCKKCQNELKKIGDSGCAKCGKLLENPQEVLCGDCRKKKHVFLWNKAVYAYVGPMKLAMYRFKYSNCRSYKRSFAKDAMEAYGDILRNLELDAIVPVPMYRHKERKRGYNQATVFAKEVSRRLEVPLYADFVTRTKNTVPQKNLNDLGRKKNLENAFKIRKRGVKLKKILLIDDIYTTGATLDGVTEILYAAGADEVYCLTVCAGRDS